MARFCGHCGSPMADGSHFCGHCGASDGLTTSTRPAQQTVLQNGAAFNRGGYMPAQYPARQRRSGKSRKGLILALCSVFAVMIVVGSVVLSNMLIGAGNYPYYNGGSSGSSYTQPTSGPGVYGTPLELSGLRENYTHLVGGGNDVITIMVYLCGADLESEYGCATTDLQEMLDADIGDNINLIVQTGGASSWYNDLVSGERCQRWQLRGGNMTLIDDTLGQQNMTEPGTLSSFVTYCAQNYPADRNILILWDHGGGTMGGFGYDENFRSSPSMSLEKMDGALASAGVNFDIVGFDACLMSTVETAYMLSDYADYLIASEESEPGDGWYYTNWLSELSHNTSMDTVELGAKIIDDFVTVCADSNSSNEATLSILELRQMPYLYEQLCAFFNDAQEQLADMQFERLSRARSDSKDFGENSFDQIDVVDFAGNADLSLSDSLTRAVDSIVRYRNTYNISGANGLAMYFPYEWLDYYESMFTLQKQLGFGSEYTNFFSNFVSVMVGGQSAYQSTPTGGTGSESSDYTDTEWFDSAAIDSYSGLYESHQTTYELFPKDGGYAMSLPDEVWLSITSLELQVMVEDGNGGYIDLGSDNILSFDDDGDAFINFQRKWVAVGGQIVPYYCLYQSTGDYWYTYGYSPALLNGERADIILRWDDDNPGGFVAGARLYYGEGETVSSRSLMQLQDGDVIQFLCRYYADADATAVEKPLGDPITVSGDLTVDYRNFRHYDCLISFAVVDIYGNRSWTNLIEVN